jgi:uncharacterized protein YoxC
MTLQPWRETGLPLAHRVRVALRTVLFSLLLLNAPAIARAQEVAAPPGVSEPAAVPMFVPGRDTVIMKQVERESSWWDTITSIAGGLMTISILVLTAALVPAALSLRKSHRTVQKTLEKVQGDLAPLLRHAAAIADDVNYISTSVRADVQQVNQTVTAVNRQLLAAVKKAEERMDEFNALLEVAQEEAESAFITTASTLRGISTGAAALAGAEPGQRRGPRRARKRQRDSDLREGMAELRDAIDEDLHEAVEAVGPGIDDSFDEEELADGDNDGRSPADGRREAPRADE